MSKVFRLILNNPFYSKLHKYQLTEVGKKSFSFFVRWMKPIKDTFHSKKKFLLAKFLLKTTY